MVPTAGLNECVTAALAIPATVAVNCWACQAVSETEAGATETLAAWLAVIKILAATRKRRHLAGRFRCTRKLVLTNVVGIMDLSLSLFFLFCTDRTRLPLHEGR